MNDEVELLEYWNVLVKRRWIVIILFVSAVLSAFVASRMMTPIYEAETSILIRDQSASSTFPFLESLANMGKNPVQNYVEVLKSRTVAAEVAARKGYDFKPGTPDFASFRNSISVHPVQGTDTIKISVQSDDPVEARDVANLVVDVFIDLSQKANREDARSAREFVESQLATVETSLRKAEEELQAFQERERILSPSDEIKAVIEKIATLETMKAEALVGLQELKQRRREVERQLSEQQQDVISATTVSDNPMVRQLRGTLVDLEIQLAGALQTVSSDHPTIMALKAQIAEAQDALKRQVERIVTAETHTTNPIYQSLVQALIEIEGSVQANQARIDALNELIAANEAEMGDLPAKELELARLTRNMQVTQDIYIMLRTRYEEMRITEAMRTANVQIIDRAITPSHPVKPRTKLNVAIAGFLGLFVGCGLAFFLEYLDTTIKSSQDVQRDLDLPVIGQIPRIEENGGRGRRRRRQSTTVANEALGRQP